MPPDAALTAAANHDIVPLLIWAVAGLAGTITLLAIWYDRTISKPDREARVKFIEATTAVLPALATGMAKAHDVAVEIREEQKKLTAAQLHLTETWKCKFANAHPHAPPHTTG